MLGAALQKGAALYSTEIGLILRRGPSERGGKERKAGNLPGGAGYAEIVKFAGGGLPFLLDVGDE